MGSRAEDSTGIVRLADVAASIEGRVYRKG